MPVPNMFSDGPESDHRGAIGELPIDRLHQWHPRPRLPGHSRIEPISPKVGFAQKTAVLDLGITGDSVHKERGQPSVGNLFYLLILAVYESGGQTCTQTVQV